MRSPTLARLARRSGAVLVGLLAGAPLAMGANTIDDGHIQHVLLITIDGMHAIDAATFIAGHPHSTLAMLSKRAVTYTAARTTSPSDSFPGMCSLMTGGLPQDTGLWYDDAFDRSLYQPADIFPTLGGGVTHGPPPTPLVPGIESVCTELIDADVTRIDAGASSLPPGATPINPAYLARNAALQPVYPHNILRVNTILEVAHHAGKRTAWADKHAAYEWVKGPSGAGCDDFFLREINSNLEADGTALPFGGPTSSVEACSNYDARKVQAIINQIHGLDGEGHSHVGTPAIFGMNFQAVSVGQKVSVDGQPQSGGFDPVNNPDGVSGMPAGKGIPGLVGTRGGYLDAIGTPTPVLAYAIDFVDQSLGRMVKALKQDGLYDSTLIVITAKHGQSPIAIATLRMKNPVPVNSNLPVHDPTDSLTGNGTADGSALPAGFVEPVLNAPPANQPHGFTQTDTIGLVWFQDDSSAAGKAAVDAAVSLLQTEVGEDTVANGPNPDAIGNLIFGGALTSQFDDPTTDPRTPDIIITPIPGTIYSGSNAKYMEHGGFGPDDTQVVMIIANPAIPAATITTPVHTTSVAPTILKSLGLDNNALQAVEKEGTPVLIGLGMDSSSPPGAITDLVATAIKNEQAGEVTLTWTAPADAGDLTGAPASYEVRGNIVPITDGNWNQSMQAPTSPAPVGAGMAESMTLKGLPSAQTLYFAVKALDAHGNASVLSNGASATTSPGDNRCGGGAAAVLLAGGALWLFLGRRRR